MTTWFIILPLTAAIVGLVAFVWIRQVRHPSAGGSRGYESRIEVHHDGWGNGASTRK